MCYLTIYQLFQSHNSMAYGGNVPPYLSAALLLLLRLIRNRMQYQPIEDEDEEEEEEGSRTPKHLHKKSTPTDRPLEGQVRCIK